MNINTKPKIAFFDFACCEGCQLTVLRLGETLFELLSHVTVVCWREVMTGSSNDYDIAFCEGSIRREKDIERIKEIREKADILVSLGTCASIGCHNAIRNDWHTDQLRQTIYGNPGFPEDVIPARPITAVVETDYQIRGCPVSMSEFVSVFKSILTGQHFEPPNEPVCVECKLNDNVCVYEKGRICLGPVTRCGCNSACTNYGEACHGCRGLVDGANLEAATRVLTGDGLHPIMALVVQSHSLSRDDIFRMFNIHNNWPGLEVKDYQNDD